jgi:cytoskeleton protein RodZ
MERIGDRLRKKREELGFTIEDVARVIRFRPETIRAVEEGRVGVFPAEAYLKAFLRAYANTLGLDADEIVREQKS